VLTQPSWGDFDFGHGSLQTVERQKAGMALAAAVRPGAARPGAVHPGEDPCAAQTCCAHRLDPGALAGVEPAVPY